MNLPSRPHEVNLIYISNIQSSLLGTGTLLSFQMVTEAKLPVSSKDTYQQMAESRPNISDSTAHVLSDLTHYLGLPLMHFNFQWWRKGLKIALFPFLPIRANSGSLEQSQYICWCSNNNRAPTFCQVWAMCLGGVTSSLQLHGVGTTVWDLLLHVRTLRPPMLHIHAPGYKVIRKGARLGSQRCDLACLPQSWSHPGSSY